MKLTGDIQHVHDPCLIREGEWYWLFSTGNGIPMRRSRDLMHWEYVQEVFAKLPEWAQDAVPRARGFWAPDIAYYKGRYILHYSLSSFGSNHSACGRATNVTLDPKRPDYAWKDEGIVVRTTTTDNWNCIDSNFIEGGREGLWLTAGSFWSGIKLLRLDEKTGKPKEGEKPLPFAFRPPDPHAIEAPFVLKRGGWWYLLTSWDFCCRGVKSTYHLRVGRAKKLTDPFLDKDGKKLTEGGGTLLLEGAAPVFGPGHCGVYQEKGTAWLAFHYYDGDTNGTPTLGIRKLTWTKDGWPEVDGSV